MHDKQDIAGLILLIKKGDQDAFKTFFTLFYGDIYRFLFKYLSNNSDAEDICQETFIKFWQQRQNIDNSSYPRAYLYKIAKNLAFNCSTRKPPSVSYDNDLKIVSLAGKDPQLEYDNKNLAEECRKIINDLPERCRMTFILSRYEGLDYSEIAETMDVSLQTVKNQMSKAINYLKEKLLTKN
ncbi:MAG: RNA polymerase sigma-70 factor [Ignavibacteriaceae bacterium]|nr:RNA polymerase sigma-70 factor [Ignavibacteriaceae bacterium]